MIDVEYTPGDETSVLKPVSDAATKWFIDTPWTFICERGANFTLEAKDAEKLVDELRSDGFCVEEPTEEPAAVQRHPVAFIYWDQEGEDEFSTGWSVVMRGADGLAIGGAYASEDEALAAIAAAGITDVVRED